MIVAGLVLFIEPTAGILGGMALSLMRFAMNMSAAVAEVVVRGWARVIGLITCPRV